jgi:hypothetical protein
MDGFPVAHPQRHAFGLGLLAHERHAAGDLAQLPHGGHVIGMGVGIDGLDQPDIEFAQQLQISIHLLQDRIDDHGLAAGPFGQQIGVGAGVQIIELAKQHGLAPPQAIRMICEYRNKYIRIR